VQEQRERRPNHLSQDQRPATMDTQGSIKCNEFQARRGRKSRQICVGPYLRGGLTAFAQGAQSRIETGRLRHKRYTIVCAPLIV
jgi:hypothetical protein